jgi:hypothetical protein
MSFDPRMPFARRPYQFVNDFDDLAGAPRISKDGVPS